MTLSNRLAVLALIPFACRSEARKDREVYDCSVSGGYIGTCLQMRYGWPEQEALLRAGRWRLEGR